EADLLPGRDPRLSVHGMGKPGERQFVFGIDVLRRRRRRGRVDVEELAAVFLQKDPRVVRVVLEVVEPRELGVDLLVRADLLVARKPELFAIALPQDGPERLVVL